MTEAIAACQALQMYFSNPEITGAIRCKEDPRQVLHK
jgi:hypothetical protein